LPTRRNYKKQRFYISDTFPAKLHEEISYLKHDLLFPNAAATVKMYSVVRSEVSPQLTSSVLVLVTGNLPGGVFESVHDRDDRKSSLKKNT
jgi:hypothetical protein